MLFFYDSSVSVRGLRGSPCISTIFLRSIFFFFRVQFVFRFTPRIARQTAYGIRHACIPHALYSYVYFTASSCFYLHWCRARVACACSNRFFFFVSLLFFHFGFINIIFMNDILWVQLNSNYSIIIVGELVKKGILFWVAISSYHIRH